MQHLIGWNLDTAALSDLMLWDDTNALSELMLWDDMTALSELMLWDDMTAPSELMVWDQKACHTMSHLRASACFTALRFWP